MQFRTEEKLQLRFSLEVYIVCTPYSSKDQKACLRRCGALKRCTALPQAPRGPFIFCSYFRVLHIYEDMFVLPTREGTYLLEKGSIFHSESYQKYGYFL